jgi:hypothetical protein
MLKSIRVNDAEAGVGDGVGAGARVAGKIVVAGLAEAGASLDVDEAHAATSSATTVPRITERVRTERSLLDSRTRMVVRDDIAGTGGCTGRAQLTTATPKASSDRSESGQP